MASSKSNKTAASGSSKTSTRSAKTSSGSTKSASGSSKTAMDRFKTEVASELGVNLKNGYNGDMTAKEAGRLGGEMVRRMIKKQEEMMK